MELQQPLGLVSWWDGLAQAGFFENQTFGFGLDTVWADSAGNERHTGLVNSMCMQHPFRSGDHVSGRDDALVSPGGRLCGLGACSRGSPRWPLPARDRCFPAPSRCPRRGARRRASTRASVTCSASSG